MHARRVGEAIDVGVHARDIAVLGYLGRELETLRT